MCIKHWQGKTKMMNKKGLLEDDRTTYALGGIGSAIGKAVSKKLAKSKSKKSTVSKENEFKDFFGEIKASEKLSVDDTERFFKNHGYKEWDGNPLESGGQAYEFKLDKFGQPEALIVYEQVGNKLEKDIFKNPTLKKVATYMGYAEGGYVRTPKAEGGSLLADDMMMVEEEQETHMMPDGTEMPGAEHEETMESDSEMEEGYLDFIIGEALSPEEEEMLMSKMEQDEELSMLFDKVIDVAQEFAGNGPVEGPGTGVSDSIPARLSDGEFVFTAKAVEEIGEDTLMSMMNEAEAAVDERQGFAEGTLVEEKPQALLSQTGIVQEDETVKGITEDMRKEVTRNIYS